jgi:hypothetical protein
MMHNRLREVASPPRWISEKACDFVDRACSGRLLAGEALRELTTVTLTLFLKLEQVAHTDTTVTANVMGDDLASIQKLVQVGAAHAKMLGGLTGSQHNGVVDNREIGTLTNTATDAEEHVTQLGPSGGPRVPLQRLKLIDRDPGSLDGPHDYVQM